MANGRLENISEVESTPTFYNADEMCQDWSTDRRRITDDKLTLEWPPTNRVRRHLRHNHIEETPTSTTEVHSYTGVTDDATDGRPTNRCAVHCRRRVGTVVIVRRRLADDFFVNITEEAAVADATVVGHCASLDTAPRRASLVYELHPSPTDRRRNIDDQRRRLLLH